MVTTNISPIYDKNSKILILGSFPSVKSREQGFFYGNPQNRFWKVTSAIFNDAEPKTIEEKKTFLLRRHIAIYDVIYSCDIIGSSDATITNVTPINLGKILENTSISAIYLNGKTAEKCFNKYLKTTLPIITLPSTSPANARFSLDKLIDEWKKIKQFLCV